MNSLVKALIQPLLEANQDNIALIPGGFKPPTLGHFYLVDQVANRPEVDKVIVLIGHKTRDGVTKEESKAALNSLLASFGLLFNNMKLFPNACL